MSDRLNILTDTYSDTEVTAICFTYVVKKGPTSENDRLLLKQDVRISEDGGADGGAPLLAAVESRSNVAIATRRD